MKSSNGICIPTDSSHWSSHNERFSCDFCNIFSFTSTLSGRSDPLSAMIILSSPVAPANGEKKGKTEQASACTMRWNNKTTELNWN